MFNRNLIIYKFKSLYHILEELSSVLNFQIFFINSDDFLKIKTEKLDNYLIVSDIIYPNIINQFIIKDIPINIHKLVEEINIEFLKIQFSRQTELKINNYTIDLNSRNLLSKDIKLRLTEKEINTIIYLFKSGRPVTVDELQEKVWCYQSDLETHTVETHIYRLRKKILNTFADNEFIISHKNGYHIK